MHYAMDESSSSSTKKCLKGELFSSDGISVGARQSGGVQPSGHASSVGLDQPPMSPILDNPSRSSALALCYSQSVNERSRRDLPAKPRIPPKPSITPKPKCAGKPIVRPKPISVRERQSQLTHWYPVLPRVNASEAKREEIEIPSGQELGAAKVDSHNLNGTACSLAISDKRSEISILAQSEKDPCSGSGEQLIFENQSTVTTQENGAGRSEHADAVTDVCRQGTVSVRNLAERFSCMQYGVNTVNYNFHKNKCVDYKNSTNDTLLINVTCSEKSDDSSRSSYSEADRNADSYIPADAANSATENQLELETQLSISVLGTNSSNYSLNISDSDHDTSSSSNQPDPNQCGDLSFVSSCADESETNQQCGSINHLINNPSPCNGPLHVSSGTLEKEKLEEEKKAKKSFYIAQEIMTSERVFVDVLKLLNIDFRNFVLQMGCVTTHENNSFDDGHKARTDKIPEQELNRILNYLPQLQNLNEDLLNDLEVRITDWEKHKRIADVIAQKGPFLKLYSAYIKEYQTQCELLDEWCSRCPAFGNAVREFEKSDRCAKLTLKHYMLKPIQRIPQYRLLLEDYLKNLPKESSDYVDSQRALAVVDSVATHANDTMKQGTNFMKLLDLQERLTSGSDFADSGSVGSQRKNTYELVKPGRYLVKEGELMKLCRRGMQPRYFILLSDVLLCTSYIGPSGSRSLRVSCELPLESTRVDTPREEDFKNEFSVISTSRSFTLRASSADERECWIKTICSTIEDNFSRRSSFLKAKMSTFTEPSTAALGKQAPVWIPDYRVTMCQQCTAEFTFTFRRHHCRACGKVVCDPCSSNKAPLQYKKYQAVRVCNQCFEILQEEFENEREEAVVNFSDGDCKKFKRTSFIRSQFKKGERDSQRSKSRRKPERLMEVCANDTHSQMSGYLRYLHRKTWRRGWYVLKERVLYEYRAPQDVCALMSRPVLGYDVESGQEMSEVPEGADVCLIFQLTHPNQPPFVFSTDAPNLTTKWIEAMNEAVILTS